jgi:pimeloyl-ACP methyl ester carboxylesterase
VTPARPGAASDARNTSFALAPEGAPVELPGHGLEADLYDTYQAPQNLTAFAASPARLAMVTLNDYANATVQAVRQAAAHGPVILVGHNLGGTTLSRVGNAVPELLDRLVYISAICCSVLRTALECIAAPENGGALQPTMPELVNPATANFTRINFRSKNPAFLATYREAVLAEATESEFLAALSFAHQPDESVGVNLEDATGNPETWGRVPRSYVHCTLDRGITLPLQRRMVADADALTPDNVFDTHDLPTSHLGGILLRPKELAAILNVIANQ